MSEDAIRELAREVGRVASAILPTSAVGGVAPDAAGGSVDSLTEAVMGMTAGLVQIAEAVDGLAAVCRESGVRARDNADEYYYYGDAADEDR